jgi:hypothetical protein
MYEFKEYHRLTGALSEARAFATSPIRSVDPYVGESAEDCRQTSVLGLTLDLGMRGGGGRIERGDAAGLKAGGGGKIGRDRVLEETGGGEYGREGSNDIDASESSAVVGEGDGLTSARRICRAVRDELARSEERVEKSAPYSS